MESFLFFHTFAEHLLVHSYRGWITSMWDGRTDGPNLTLRGSFVSIISRFLGDFTVTSMKRLWAKTPPGWNPHLLFDFMVL